MLQAYTDGSVYPNPKGVGGWSFILVDEDGNETIRTGGVNMTSNNRMELHAVIEVMSYVKVHGNKGEHLRIFSDSKYVVSGVNYWVESWNYRGVRDKANMDLWDDIFALKRDVDTQIVWVKGHGECEYNERADKLANEARKEFEEEELERMWQKQSKYT